MEYYDLLNPSDFSELYRHQLKQTISAYNPTQIVLGEALQNAIDAIVEADGTSHEITINLEREAEDPRELKLMIAWDEGISNSDQFGFAAIEHSMYHEDLVYPGVTRYLQNTKSGPQIQVLLLKSVVDSIRKQQIADE